MYSNSKFFRGLLITILVLPFFILSNQTFAGLVIVVNKSNNVDIDKESVKKIFMGRTNTFINGEKATPIDLKKGTLRSEFLTEVLNKDEGTLQSYWTRMVFTGKGNPPEQYKSDDEVKKLVAANPSAIGYIDSAKVDDTVRVVEINQ